MSEATWTAKAEAWEDDEQIITVSNGKNGSIVGGTVSKADAARLVNWLNARGALYDLVKLLDSRPSSTTTG